MCPGRKNLYPISTPKKRTTLRPPRPPPRNPPHPPSNSAHENLRNQYMTSPEPAVGRASAKASPGTCPVMVRAQQHNNTRPSATPQTPNPVKKHSRPPPQPTFPERPRRYCWQVSNLTWLRDFSGPEQTLTPSHKDSMSSRPPAYILMSL